MIGVPGFSFVVGRCLRLVEERWPMPGLPALTALALCLAAWFLPGSSIPQDWIFRNGGMMRTKATTYIVMVVVGGAIMALATRYGYSLEDARLKREEERAN